MGARFFVCPETCVDKTPLAVGCSAFAKVAGLDSKWPAADGSEGCPHYFLVHPVRRRSYRRSRIPLAPALSQRRCRLSR